MIEKIHIKNFKSIYDLEIEVGRVNLFIGENGSGKSNLLEALVFVSASDSNKLDNEFLVSRGIRVTEPNFMRSAFDNKDINKNIAITISHTSNHSNKYVFSNNNAEYSKWEIVQSGETVDLELTSDIAEEIENYAKEFNMNVSQVIDKLIKNFHNSLIDIFIIYSRKYSS